MNQDIYPQDLMPRMNLTQQSIDRTTKPESNANVFFKIGEMFGDMTNEKYNLKKKTNSSAR